MSCCEIKIKSNIKIIWTIFEINWNSCKFLQFVYIFEIRLNFLSLLEFLKFMDSFEIYGIFSKFMGFFLNLWNFF